MSPCTTVQGLRSGGIESMTESYIVSDLVNVGLSSRLLLDILFPCATCFQAFNTISHASGGYPQTRLSSLISQLLEGVFTHLGFKSF